MSAAATFCATLVDQWILSGVRHAVIAPGSRSTPMAIALAARDELSVQIVHDERVAAFLALGLGLHGSPALLLCTSGTAAVNFHPAIVEASLSEVPMIVLTADRPPELRGVGAPQTIDQTHLYGGSVRWYHDPGVPDDRARATWRQLADHAWRHAATGPVHLNLPFVEPLVGEAGPLPPAPPLATAHAATPSSKSGDAVPGRADVERGIIIAGGRSGVDAMAVEELSARTGWPILADATSPVRGRDGVITAADALLRHRAFAEGHRAELAVRIGRPPASRVVATWLTANSTPIVQVGGPGTIDPEGLVVARCTIEDLLAHSWSTGRSTVWRESWRDGERRAQAAITETLMTVPLSEPAVARQVAQRCRNRTLVVASSMPIRDLEWFGGSAPAAHANRGANGIDGTIATAIGTALSAGPTTVLIGDLAFLHDSSALIGLADRGVHLQIIVIDNDGGGIFSFLPQARELVPERFEQLFGTPHGTDLVLLCQAHGLDVEVIESPERLHAHLDEPPAGVSVAIIRSDRNDNVEVHRRLEAAVATALDAAP